MKLVCTAALLVLCTGAIGEEAAALDRAVEVGSAQPQEWREQTVGGAPSVGKALIYDWDYSRGLQYHTNGTFTLEYQNSDMGHFAMSYCSLHYTNKFTLRSTGASSTKITLIMTNPVTRQAVETLMLNALSAHGFVLVVTGDVIRLEKMPQQSLPPVSGTRVTPAACAPVAPRIPER